MTGLVHIKHERFGELDVLSDTHHIYLKQICRVHITVQISDLKYISGQSRCLSTWEISEKLRQLCPNVLIPSTQMKVTCATVELVRFVVELHSRTDVRTLIQATDSQNIKLSGFPQTLRVRSGIVTVDCPRKHDWDAFFRDAKNMNELLPGERPDTVVISRIPVRWFSSHSGSSFFPDPSLVKEVFGVFGTIRCIDIPMLDPCQNPRLLTAMGLSAEKVESLVSKFVMKLPTTGGWESLQQDQNGFGRVTPSTIKLLFKGNASHDYDDSLSPLTFTAFIQYSDYSGFAAAMETLRGKKLVHVPENNSDCQRLYSAELKVDFDRTKHLSKGAIRCRQAARFHIEAEVRAEKVRLANERADHEERRRRALEWEAEEKKQMSNREAPSQKRSLGLDYGEKTEVELQKKRTRRQGSREAFLEEEPASAVSKSSVAIQTTPERRPLSPRNHLPLSSSPSGKGSAHAKPIRESEAELRGHLLKKREARLRGQMATRSALESTNSRANEVLANSPLVETDAEKIRQKLLRKREVQLRERLQARWKQCFNR